MSDPNNRSLETSVTGGAGASGACSRITLSTGTGGVESAGGIGAPTSAKSTNWAPWSVGCHLRSMPAAGPVGSMAEILSPGGYTWKPPWRPESATEDLTASVTVAGWPGDTKASQAAGGSRCWKKPRRHCSGGGGGGTTPQLSATWNATSVEGSGSGGIGPPQITLASSTSRLKSPGSPTGGRMIAPFHGTGCWMQSCPTHG